MVGKSHKVNNLIRQLGNFNSKNINKAPPKSKRCRRFFTAPNNKFFDEYYSGKRIGQRSIIFKNNNERDFLMENQNLIYLSWVLCRKETVPQIKYLVGQASKY